MKLQKVCVYCNKTFIAQTTKTRYCSHNCNRKFLKEETRNLKLKASNNEFLQKKLQGTDSVQALDCKPYLNIKEACLLLNASDSTIRKMIKDGILPTMRIGVKHLIRKSDIEKQFHLAR